MTTLVKKSKKQRSPKTVTNPELPQGAYERIAADKILINTNYRGPVDDKDLQELAEDIKIRDIISPVTVRPTSSGNFELVAGERRVRAAAIAGIALIPCMVKELTDDEVLEIQLSENLNRENPHPLKEAFAILQMQQRGKSFEEICARMAKSKSFVYQRLRLAQLDACFHGVFLANKLNTALALKLAELSPDTQQQLYEEYFDAWDDEDFETDDYLETVIENLRFDLHKATFSIRSKSLVPEAGACINCRYNSATLGSLFPELAKTAVCSHPACFQQKSVAHYHNLFNKALEKEQPQALITVGNIEPVEYLLENHEAAKTLPVYRYYDVNIPEEPEQPVPEDYEDDEAAEGEPRFDQTGFDLAMAEYKEELDAFALAQQSGELKKALYLKRDEIKIIWFTERSQQQNTPSYQPKVTAKAVQEAIKSGVATTGLLQAEISRIRDREKRALELDKEKVQLKVHEALKASLEQPLNDLTLTEADLIAQRYLVYESLDWSAKKKADQMIFSGIDRMNHQTLYYKLAELTEAEQAYLIRLAIAEKSGSQYPQQSAGAVLYKTAEGIGMDVTAIEQAQVAKAAERKEKMDARIEELETKIKAFE